MAEDEGGRLLVVVEADPGRGGVAGQGGYALRQA
jgi:hypothetical protein